jgi:hypothetical protein
LKVCLVEPDTTVGIINRAWLSFLFDLEIIPLSECVDRYVFPLYIVHGNTNIDKKYRSIEFDYFRNLSESGHRFGFVHLMDESYDHNLSAYGLNGCRVIFREYVRPKGGKVELLASYLRSFSLAYPHFEDSLLSHPRIILSQFKYRFTNGAQFLIRQHLPRLPDKAIHHIPLGYTDIIAEFSGLGVPSIEARKYVWSFCGDIFKSDRQKMLASLSEIKPHYCHVYQGFMGTDSLSGRDYWEVLSNSIYSPCPIGNVNIDSYRLFESLEAGAIPMVIYNHAGQPYDYYRELLGDHPIPTFRRWEQARDFIHRTSTNEIILLNQRISKWYKSYKREIQTSIRKMLASIASGL